LRREAETVESTISKLLSQVECQKKGASTSPGALTKLCTAVNKFKGEGLAIAKSKSSASLVSSMFQRFCTAGFHAEGLPQGILLASLITLHKSGEIASKAGTSVKRGTEMIGAGGVRKGSNGSREGGTGAWETKKKNKKKTSKRIKYSRLITVAQKQTKEKKRLQCPTFTSFIVSDFGDLSPAAVELQEWIVTAFAKKCGKDLEQMDVTLLI